MTFEFTPEEVFPFGYQVYKLVKNRYLNMGSIGADSQREEVITEKDGRRTLVFREWKLYEYAVVPIGSNDSAMVTQREEVKELLARDIPDDAAIKKADTYLHRAKDEEKPEGMDDSKISAECSTTDKGTFINVKIRREKDGKVVESLYRDVIQVEETPDQIKFRDYFEKNKDVIKEYRDFMDMMYKRMGITQSKNESTASCLNPSNTDVALNSKYFAAKSQSSNRLYV